MKKILILAAAAAVLCSCGNKNKYTVEGTVAGANDKVYLLDEEDTVLDSAVVKNGKFRLSGIAEAPAVAILRDARDLRRDADPRTGTDHCERRCRKRLPQEGDGHAGQ